LGTIGWMLRDKNRAYALALQGGSIGIIYLTAFSGLRLYELISAPFAFAIFVALGVISALLALINDARILAFLAIIGAFLAPMLASTGEGSHVTLFSYYAVVNAGILAIAWFKAWRSLNLVGFLFTLGAGAAWGLDSYGPQLFNSTEPFLILFFLFYVAIAVLFALRQENPHNGYIDATLVFGNPIAALIIQRELIAHLEYGLAWSTVAAAGLYMILAVALYRYGTTGVKRVAEWFLFWALFFIALSIPLFFEAQITAAIWAILGAAWVGMGVYRRKLWQQIKGVLIQWGAGCFFAVHLLDIGILETIRNGPTIFNTFIIGCLILSLSAIVSAWLCHRERNQIQGSYQNPWNKFFSYGLLAWGLAWWFSGGLIKLMDQAPETLLITYMLIFLATSGFIAELIGRWLRWPALRAPMLLMLPIYMILAVMQLSDQAHNFLHGGWYAWPLAWIAYYWMLYNQDVDYSIDYSGKPNFFLQARLLAHVGIFWLIFVQATLWLWGETWDWLQANEYGVGWTAVPLMIMPALIIWSISRYHEHLPWPIRMQRDAYLKVGLGGIVFFILAVGIVAVTSPGDSQPLPYLPLLNPLDIGYLGLFVALWCWLRALQKLAYPARDSTHLTAWDGGLALLAFLAINFAIARAVYQFTDVPFDGEALFNSPLLQTSYAIFWGMLSLALMFAGNWRKEQPIWFAGAFVLVITLLKLFIIDLASTGTIARIVSFIGVGVLILVIAYFAPVPTEDSQA